MLMFIYLGGLTTILILLYLYNHLHFKKFPAIPETGDFITIDNLTLHYISKGAGRPIVFIHGGILTGNDFEKVIDMVATHGYQAISFDRPGYGYSQRPVNKKITPFYQAYLIHEALLKLNINNPIIAGHSWSGVMILAYALMFPKYISGLLTISIAAYKEGYPATNGDFISELIQTPLLGNLVLNTLLYPFGKIMAKSMINITFKPDSIPENYEKDTYKYWLRPSQFKANREDVLAFAPAADEINNRYQEINVPTIILVGDKDPFGVIEQAHRLNKAITTSKLLKVPNIGHMIPQCHPKIVLDAIKEFDEVL